MLEKATIRQLGDELYTALREQQVVEPLTERLPNICMSSKICNDPPLSAQLSG